MSEIAGNWVRIATAYMKLKLKIKQCSEEGAIGDLRAILDQYKHKLTKIKHKAYIESNSFLSFIVPKKFIHEIK